MAGHKQGEAMKAERKQSDLSELKGIYKYLIMQCEREHTRNSTNSEDTKSYWPNWNLKQVIWIIKYQRGLSF